MMTQKQRYLKKIAGKIDSSQSDFWMEVTEELFGCKWTKIYNTGGYIHSYIAFNIKTGKKEYEHLFY